MTALPHPLSSARPHGIRPAALAAALLLSLAAPLPATADKAAQRAALAAFSQARGGDDSRIDAAATQLAAISRAEPGHPLWLAYAGAATALRAGTTWAPWKKMAHAEDGLAQIDKALALLGTTHETTLHDGVPVALETKLTAASTFLALPSMFNRGERGRRLLDEVLKHPAYAATPTGFQEAARKLAAKAAS